jgi:hypothetical protein
MKLVRVALCIASVSFLLRPAPAEEIRVLRTKGKNAIVQFRDAPPALNSRWTIQGSEAGGSGTMAPVGPSQRGYLIDLSTSFVKPLVEGGGMSMALAGRGGVNMGQMEAGAGLGFSKATGSSLGLSLLGWADLNFLRNDPGTNFVPGVSAGVSFGKAGEFKTFGGDVGVFVKAWFLRQSSTAFRLDLKMAFSKISGLDGMGKAIGVAGGLVTYF